MKGMWYGASGRLTSPARRPHRYRVVQRQPRGRIRYGSQVRTHYPYRPTLLWVSNACCQVYSPQWDIWLMKVYIGRANASPTMGTPLSNRLQPAGLIAIVWFSVGLATMFIIARTFLRVTRVKGLGYEDFCIHFAYLMLVVNAVLQTVQVPDLYYIDRAQAGALLTWNGDQYVKYEYCILGLFWTTLWSVKARQARWQCTEGCLMTCTSIGGGGRLWHCSCLPRMLIAGLPVRCDSLVVPIAILRFHIELPFWFSASPPTWLHFHIVITILARCTPINAHLSCRASVDP